MLYDRRKFMKKQKVSVWAGCLISQRSHRGPFCRHPRSTQMSRETSGTAASFRNPRGGEDKRSARKNGAARLVSSLRLCGRGQDCSPTCRTETNTYDARRSSLERYSINAIAELRIETIRRDRRPQCDTSSSSRSENRVNQCYCAKTLKT